MLTSSALIDDVVALVLLQVVSELGGSTTVEAVTVVRPIAASVGMLIGTAGVVRWILLPVQGLLQRRVAVGRGEMIGLATMTLAAFAAVSAAMYAGTSALLGIYLAGLGLAIADRHSGESTQWPTYRSVFEAHVQQSLDFILAPLFFASIGFAIPIKRMFDGEVVWQGVVFALLMTIGKVRCMCEESAHSADRRWRLDPAVAGSRSAQCPNAVSSRGRGREEEHDAADRGQDGHAARGDGGKHDGEGIDQQ